MNVSRGPSATCLTSINVTNTGPRTTTNYVSTYLSWVVSGTVDLPWIVCSLWLWRKHFEYFHSFHRIHWGGTKIGVFDYRNKYGPVSGSSLVSLNRRSNWNFVPTIVGEGFRWGQEQVPGFDGNILITSRCSNRNTILGLKTILETYPFSIDQ